MSPGCVSFGLVGSKTKAQKYERTLKRASTCTFRLLTLLPHFRVGHGKQFRFQRRNLLLALFLFRGQRLALLLQFVVGGHMHAGLELFRFHQHRLVLHLASDEVAKQKKEIVGDQKAVARTRIWR